MNSAARKFLIAATAALGAVLITQEEVLRLGLLQRLELASLDYRFQARGKSSALPDSSHVVIVEINDESFKTLPDRWPWPRSYYARLARNLKAAGAKVVGIDLLLGSADPYDARDDDDLRNAIRETGIVVLAGKMDAESKTFNRHTADDNFGNIFYAIDSALGLVNVRNDADGVYRRYSPYWESTRVSAGGGADTTRIPTFSFSVLNKYFGLPPRTTASNDASDFRYADRVIPKYDATSLLINLQGSSGSFRSIKFADVLDDSSMTTTEEAQTKQQINTFNDPEFGYLHDGTFRDKIVLVGSTTPEDHDLFPVGIARGEQHGDNLMYGVEIHANVIESVVRGDFLYRQPNVWEILSIVLFSLCTFYVLSLLRSSRSRRHFVIEFVGILFVLCEIVFIAVAALVLFTKHRYVVAAISPMVGVAFGYIASTAFHYVTERKQRLLIKNMFSTYVNATVVDQLIAEPERLKLGGERKEMSVLFSDMEGFTTLSERMPPEALVAFLNEYLSEMTECILADHGTLDKFFGDAVIAFWGAPVPQNDHALRACRTALAMQHKLSTLRSQWQREGKPEVNVRIGINTGEMVVGNLGGTGKFDYTVIGDSVNIASRLEGANKVYRTNTIVSEATFALVREQVVARELDLITVKGRSDALRVYELLAMKGGEEDATLTEFLARYSEAVQLYRERRWNGALQLLNEAQILRPDDYPTQLYLERTTHFKHNPPPDDWNGVFELTTK